MARDTRDALALIGAGLIVVLLAIGCAESPSPVAPSSVPLAGGSARVSLQSTRDLAPLSPGHQCPSGPVSDFRINPASEMGKVTVLFRRVSDQETVTGYLLETRRRNSLRPGGYELPRLDIVQPESELYGFRPGVYDARITPMCLRQPTGAWAMTDFGVAGNEQTDPVALILIETPECHAGCWQQPE